MNANPRRKIRAGDRVTETPGIVTVADVDRMLVETSVGEADVHRVAVGQTVHVVLEALRDRKFTGKVTRVGTVARSSAERPMEDKRFDQTSAHVLALRFFLREEQLRFLLIARHGAFQHHVGAPPVQRQILLGLFQLV